MAYFSERSGLKREIEKTKQINNDVYSAIMDVCKKYFHNLTWKFSVNCRDDFTNKDYQTFDNNSFLVRVKLKFPSLFSAVTGVFCADVKPNEEFQYSFLDFIEYIAENIKDIKEGWNNPIYKNFWYIECKTTCEIFNVFQSEINEIFIDAGVLYKLNKNKQIERVIENDIITSDIIDKIHAISENGLKDLLEVAILKHKSPKEQENKDAVEKIWDALERLKTYYTDLDKKESSTKIINDMADSNSEYITLFTTEFKALTEIGNKFCIRHHETDKIDITDIRHYDYFFNRCLSLIALAIQYLR